MIRRFILAAAMAAALLASAPDGRRWWSHVQYLADDKLEGRDTGSAGHRKAAAYVAGEFERAGLKPAGTDGYIQPVRFHTRRLKEIESSLTLVRNGRSQAVRLPADFRFTGSEVYVRRDPATGDVILSRRPDSWQDFFDLTGTLDIPEDFLSHRRDTPPQKRKLF